jgi:hypothetical protein
VEVHCFTSTWHYLSTSFSGEVENYDSGINESPLPPSKTKSMTRPMTVDWVWHHTHFRSHHSFTHYLEVLGWTDLVWFVSLPYTWNRKEQYNNSPMTLSYDDKPLVLPLVQPTTTKHHSTGKSTRVRSFQYRFWYSVWYSVGYSQKVMTWTKDPQGSTRIVWLVSAMKTMVTLNPRNFWCRSRIFTLFASVDAHAKSGQDC